MKGRLNEEELERGKHTLTHTHTYHPTERHILWYQGKCTGYPDCILLASLNSTGEVIDAQNEEKNKMLLLVLICYFKRVEPLSSSSSIP
jgi:hypothetical protein